MRSTEQRASHDIPPTWLSSQRSTPVSLEVSRAGPRDISVPSCNSKGRKLLLTGKQRTAQVQRQTKKCCPWGEELTTQPQNPSHLREIVIRQVRFLLLLNSILLHPIEIVPKNGQWYADWLVQQLETGFPTEGINPTIITFHSCMIGYQVWGTVAHDRKQTPCHCILILRRWLLKVNRTKATRFSRYSRQILR